jgi:hypothetical protein
MTIDGNVDFAGDGITLKGPNLKFDGAKKTLLVDGEGQMEFPPSQLMKGDTPAIAGMLKVAWRRRMNFDGLTARFEDSVVATTEQQELRTQLMKVTLQRPIQLTEEKTGDRADIDNIQCFGGALLKNRSFDAEQQLCSFDQLQVSDLTVSLVTGAVNGSAGWINSVQYASADMLGGPNPAGKMPPIDTPPQKQLFCLHVTFEKEMIGNLGDIRSFSHGWLTFSDRVHVTYGPVDNWEAQLATSDPDELGPKGMVANCDQLTVSRTLTPVKRSPSFELQATDNVKVEGTDFTARGHRITYNQEKDLVILEGDSRNDAELWRELPGGNGPEHTSGQKFYYWRKTKTIKFDGLQPTEFNMRARPNGK